MLFSGFAKLHLIGSIIKDNKYRCLSTKNLVIKSLVKFENLAKI